MNLASLILTLAIISGQLIRVPLFSQGALTMLDIIVILTGSLGLLKLKFKLKRPPLFVISAFIFILFATISLLLTPLFLTPMQKLNAFSYTLRFSSYIFLGWVIYSGAFPKVAEKIHLILISSGAGLAALGLLQLLFLPNLNFMAQFGWDPHYFRTVSTFFDPNFAGAFFVLTIILILYFQPFKNPKIFYLIFAVTFLALLTTFSRSSYLMFLTSGLSLSFLKKSKILALKIILLFLILILGFQIYTQMVSKPRNIDRGQSASFRINTWQQGLQIFEKNPVLGVGFNAYRYALIQYNLGDEQFLQSRGSSSNDSSLLYVASTTGIIGLLSYLYFLLILVKGNETYRIIMFALVLGLLVHSVFANSLFYPAIFIFLILLCASPRK